MSCDEPARRLDERAHLSTTDAICECGASPPAGAPADASSPAGSRGRPLPSFIGASDEHCHDPSMLANFGGRSREPSFYFEDSPVPVHHSVLGGIVKPTEQAHLWMHLSSSLTPSSAELKTPPRGVLTCVRVVVAPDGGDREPGIGRR